MSSMRNAVQRRNHKERAQPFERQRWGILEKRKDYKLRAADHKSKLARLKILKQKSQDRNPDEFSFAMLNSKVDSQGQKIADRGNKPLSMDVVKLLKTQDVGYLRTQLQIVRKERQRLEEEIVLEDRGAVRAVKNGEEEGQKGRHTVFVGKKEEQKGFKPEDWFGTSEDGVQKAWNRPRKSVGSDQNQNEEEDVGESATNKKSSKKQQEAEKLRWKEETNMRKKRERIQERRISHLDSVKARERDLMIAEEELEKQRAKMNCTTGGVNKNGVKYKIRERKR